MRLTLTLFIIILLLFSTSFALNWESICDRPGMPYCEDVGKTAHNAFGIAAIREIALGKIIGVAWRPKGSIIGYEAAIPKAGLPASVRLSPRSAYYYIIDNGSGKSFLRQCREIDPR